MVPGLGAVLRVCNMTELVQQHECFSVFHHLQKDKQRKQRHSSKLGKKTRESPNAITALFLQE